MAICRIKQGEIFPSGAGNDSLDPTNAPSSANLEEDLDYIRSVLRSFFGTSSWYDVPNGSFNDVLDAFPVQHYTASDDPSKVGYHKDIIADSLAISGGDIDLSSGNFTFDNGVISVSSATSISLVSTSTFNTEADSYAITSAAGDIEFRFSSSGTGIKLLDSGNSLRLQVLDEGKIIFSANQSSGTQLINFGSGYSIYQDNEGPGGEPNGNRLWITGPDGSTDASGVVIGPRAGAERLRKIRLRATITQLEGGNTPLFVTTNLDSTATAHNLARLQSSNGSGFATHVTGTRKIIAPINSGTIDWGHEFYFDEGSKDWSIEVDRYLHVVSATGYLNVGSANTSHVHFYTDRPDYYFNKTIKVDGGIGFWQLSQTKQYRIYLGSTFPATPQEGDIWFKI